MPDTLPPSYAQKEILLRIREPLLGIDYSETMILDPSRPFCRIGIAPRNISESDALRFKKSRFTVGVSCDTHFRNIYK